MASSTSAGPALLGFLPSAPPAPGAVGNHQVCRSLQLLVEQLQVQRLLLSSEPVEADASFKKHRVALRRLRRPPLLNDLPAFMVTAENKPQSVTRGSEPNTVVLILTRRAEPACAFGYPSLRSRGRPAPAGSRPGTRRAPANPAW